MLERPDNREPSTGWIRPESISVELSIAMARSWACFTSRRAPEALNGVAERGKLDRPRMFHPPHVRRIFSGHFLFGGAQLANDGVSQREVPLANLGNDDGDGVMQGVE